MQDTWDKRFIKMAREVAGWSKDRTKVGAVIARRDHSLVSVGFNGLVPGMDDDEYLKDREMKNLCIRHAEENALFFAGKEEARGATMYLYGLTPCGRCAADISMHKIGRLVCVSEPAHPDWAKSQEAAWDVLYNKNHKHKVEIIQYDKKVYDDLEGVSK